MKFDTKQIIDFLENTKEDVLTKWDIVLIEGKRENIDSKDQFIVNPDISIVPIKRGFDITKNKVNIGERSGRLASPTDARNGLSKEQIKIAKIKAGVVGDLNEESKTIKQEVWFKYVPDRNPLLMIYFIRLKDEDIGITEQTFIDKLNGIPVMGFSVGFPMSKDSYAAEFHKYKVNLIYARQEIDENLEESIEE